MSSDWRLSTDEMKKWDAVAMRAIEEKKINFYDSIRLFTYLYVAQSEVALLSKNMNGSFDPISYQVLSLFLTSVTKPKLFIEDPLSSQLSTLVFKKIKERVEQENRLPRTISISPSLKTMFSAGLQVAKWIPWYAKPEIAYWPTPPPPAGSPIWQEQIAKIKQAQDPMTTEKKQITYRWAGLAYPWSDDWRSIVNAYLFCHDVSFQKTVRVRSLLMVGLYDCVNAYASAKYHYLAMRPQVVDATIQYEIEVPKHPSYPAGHSTESTLTATLMSFFFPENATYWQELANQCGLSRIWAGVHYPIDDQGGRICGKKVAERVLQAFTQP